MSEVSHPPPTHWTPALLSTSGSYFNDKNVGLLKLGHFLTAYLSSLFNCSPFVHACIVSKETTRNSGLIDGIVANVLSTRLLQVSVVPGVLLKIKGYSKKRKKLKELPGPGDCKWSWSQARRSSGPPMWSHCLLLWPRQCLVDIQLNIYDIWYNIYNWLTVR